MNNALWESYKTPGVINKKLDILEKTYQEGLDIFLPIMELVNNQFEDYIKEYTNYRKNLINLYKTDINDFFEKENLGYVDSINIINGGFQVTWYNKDNMFDFDNNIEKFVSFDDLILMCVRRLK